MPSKPIIKKQPYSKPTIITCVLNIIILHTIESIHKINAFSSCCIQNTNINNNVNTHISLLLARQQQQQPLFTKTQQHIVNYNKPKIKSHSGQRRVITTSLKSKNNDNDDEDNNIDNSLQKSIKSMTVPDLKQQLRLRGLKVSGKKQELIDRLMEDIAKDNDEEYEESVGTDGEKGDEAKEFCKDNGKKLTDVSEYIEDDDNEEEDRIAKIKKQEEDEDAENVESWGEEARVLYENDDQPVVDNLSRTTIEFKSGKDRVKAYVVASREALRGYLVGGSKAKSKNDTDPEDQVKDVQASREKANKMPVKENQDENVIGIDDPEDKDGRYNILERDYSDWGVYTTTGAQISASEVEAVLFLSDVHGPFSNDCKALCDRIAFECQPCVVMAPDLFRDDPWKEDTTTKNDNPGHNEKGESYEEWRSSHSDERVNVDIRSAAIVLRERYGISALAVFGICFGGGKALEVAAGWTPQSESFASLPLARPKACVAWYPTRYNTHALFGPTSSNKLPDKNNKVAIMALFAEKDTIPGARVQDAEELKNILEKNNNENIIDYMVKVYPNQEHGFAHQQQYLDEIDDAPIPSPERESAFLLSSAWIETYTRLFLPTVGTAVKDDSTSEWCTELEMKELRNMQTRDIREEIQKEIEDHIIEDEDDFLLDYSDVGQQQW